MKNAHPSQFTPRGTAPPSTIPVSGAAANRDADALQRAIKRVQDYNAKLLLAPEEFAERFRSRIMNSGKELTVEQVFAKLDADVGMLLLSRHQEFLPRLTALNSGHVAVVHVPAKFCRWFCECR